MKKLICIILGLFLFTCSYGQAIINRSGPANTVQDARWMSQYNAFLPRYNDTTAANLQKGIDSCGAIIFTYDIAALWFRSCSNGSKQWVQILPAGSPTPGGQAWVNPINVNLFTDASLNASFGTFGPNGIYFKTNNTTRWYLDRNGIAPETGTSVGIGIDPSDSNRITYFSGSGTTPTWQQTLTAGSTLNTDNTIAGGGFDFTWNNVDNYFINTVGSFGATSQVGNEATSISNSAGSIVLQADASTGNSNFRIYHDSIKIEPLVGLFYIDTLTNAIGTKSLRYNPTTGLVSYADTTSIATPTWQQTLTAGSTLNISNNINSGNNTQSFSWPTLGGGNLGMYISSESSTAATGGEILLQVTTTHTPVATGITTYSADIQNSSIGTNLTNIALMAGATEGATNIAAWFNRGKVRFGTSGTESGILDIVGATSGTITFQPQAAAGTYNWNWPTTAGTSGYLLTSGGGGSSAMTWTAPGANTALSNLSSVAINTSLLPGTDDGAALGSTSKEFSDLFLASGGVINWANGNTTLTQTSGALTLGGGFYATSSVAAGTYLYGGDKYNTYTGYTGAVLGGITTHAVLDFVDNNSRIGEFYTDASNFNFFTDVSKGIVFYVNNSFTAPALQFSSAGALRLGYLGAGALTADASGNITSVSDERLKNIEGGYGVGLSQVYKINPIVYKWKPETKLDSLNSYIGFSAQNIEYALGENAVGINRDGYKSIQDRAILAALTNSIKELKDLNDSQQKEIDDLKKEVKKLKRL